MEQYTPRILLSGVSSGCGKTTWPDEKIFRCTVETLAQTVADNGLTKTALLIVGGCLGDTYLRSKLYDPGFTTEYRRGTEL